MYIIAERLNAGVLILQSMLSVGGVWPQLPSRFRNAISHALGMQLKVWLVHKHPSHLGHLRKFVIPSAVAALAVSLSQHQDDQKL